MKNVFLVLSFCFLSFSFAQAQMSDGATTAQPAPSALRHKQFRESFALAQKHWRELRPAKYNFQLQIQCFCRDTEPKMIYVQNKTVVKVVDMASDKELDKKLYAQYTIDGIFNSIAKFLRQNPYSVTGAFDAVNGSPLLFRVDIDQRMADEEMGYVITNFGPTE